MYILFYPDHMDSIGRKIEEIITVSKSKGDLQVFSSVDKLTIRLHEPRRNLKIIVLLPGNKDDLLNLILIREKMADIPVVLILPNQSKEHIAMGHQLFPRFVSYQDSDLTDVAGVIYRILKNNRVGIGGNNETI